jgi:hypothetical protein
MVVRIRRNKVGGLSKYLREGLKKGSDFSRNEKDIVTPVGDGNLDEFEKIEKYVLNEKKFSEISMHFSFGFSTKDWEKIESLPSKDEQMNLMKELINDYLSHHFSGYDINNELYYYSEVHTPKIKYENGCERFSHIHLVVSFLNILNDTKVRNLFAKNSYYDEAMVRKSNYKFGFEQTKKREFRTKNFDSQVGRDRKKWVELLDDLNDREELIYFLENQMNFKEGIDYRVVSTKSNNYIKLINKSYKTDKSGKKIITDINIQGGGFHRFVDANSTEKNHKKLEDMTQEELEEILNDVYVKRVEEIGKRRSKKATEDLKKIYEEDKQLKKDFEKKYSQQTDYNSFKSLSFQEILFFKHYGMNIQLNLNNYYINVDDVNGNTTFTNKSKNIKVEDKGNEIIGSSSSTSLKEKVELMISIADAKKFNLLELDIQGSPEFIKEAKRQILKKVEEENKNQEKKVEIKSIRPVSVLDNFILENDSKIFEFEKVNNIQFLKENLSAQAVLKFAKQTYNIKIDEFEVVDGNKINNKTNRQKPKSNIDFLTKEIGISIKEATKICNDLIVKQPIKVNNEAKGEEELQELVQQHQKTQIHETDLKSNSKSSKIKNKNR